MADKPPTTLSISMNCSWLSQIVWLQSLTKVSQFGDGIPYGLLDRRDVHLDARKALANQLRRLTDSAKMPIISPMSA